MAKSPTTARSTKPKAPKKTAAGKSRKANAKAQSVESTVPGALAHTRDHEGITLRAGSADDLDRLSAFATMFDAAIALGRVRITGAAITGDLINLHAVTLDHPQPFDRIPGVILTIDLSTDTMFFDNIRVGIPSAALIDDATVSILNAIRGDQLPFGRCPDWFDRAADAIHDVRDRYRQAIVGNLDAGLPNHHDHSQRGFVPA